MNLGKLFKAAKGAASLEEMLEMLSALGIEAEVKPVNTNAEGQAFAAAAAQPGAALFHMKAKLKGGQPMLAFFVLPPA